MQKHTLLFCLLAVALVFKVCGQEDVQTLKSEIKSLQERVQVLESAKTSDKTEKQGETKAKKDDKPVFNIFWKDAPYFETEDKAFSFEIHGRMHADFGFIKEDDEIAKISTTKLEDYGEVRAARIGVKGTIYEQFYFQADYELSDGKVTLRENLFGIKKLPMNGVFQVGYYKEPFGLEQLTSDNYLTFMERGTVSGALTPSYSLGLSYYAATDDKKFSLALGFFREKSDAASAGQSFGDSGSYAFTTRAVALPFFENDGKELVHLGIAYSYRNPYKDTKTYGSRPESHGVPFNFSTVTVPDVEDVHMLGLEAALVFGPFSLQSELIYSWLRAEGGQSWGHEHFWGYYVYGSFFLTGESRKYNAGANAGLFGNVKPLNNFLSKDGGMGAFEFAVRYSKLDLNEDVFYGGRLDDITIGFNWYWNPNMRMMLEYVYTRIDRPDKIPSMMELVDAHIFMARFQLHF